MRKTLREVVESIRARNIVIAVFTDNEDEEPEAIYKGVLVDSSFSTVKPSDWLDPPTGVLSFTFAGTVDMVLNQIQIKSLELVKFSGEPEGNGG